MGKPGIKELPRHLTGLGAMVLSLYFMVTRGTDPAIAVASSYFFLACAIDTRYAKIPNLLNALMALAGLLLSTAASGWSGALLSLSGLALGIALLLLPYLMGGFGAGDVKALGALGALVGPHALMHIFVYMALFGGGMAVLHYVFHHDLAQKTREAWTSIKASALSRDLRQLKPSSREPLRFPYAAAIAFGYYSYLSWGGVL